MDRLYYLTEEQFHRYCCLLPPEDSGRGRPPKIRNREALEGILHILRTGYAVARFTACSTGRGTPFTCAGTGGWSAACGGIS